MQVLSSENIYPGLAVRVLFFSPPCQSVRVCVQNNSKTTARPRATFYRGVNLVKVRR